MSSHHFAERGHAETRATAEVALTLRVLFSHHFVECGHAKNRATAEVALTILSTFAAPREQYARYGVSRVLRVVSGEFALTDTYERLEPLVFPMLEYMREFCVW